MKNIKISIRLTMLTTFCVICILLLSSYFISAISDIHDNSELIAENWMPVSVSAANINAYVSKYRICEYKHVVMQDDDAVKAVDAQLDSCYKQVQDEISKLEEYTIDENIKKSLSTVKQYWESYVDFSKEAIKLSSAHKSNEAISILLGDSLNAYNTVSTASSELVALSQEGASAADEKTHSQYENTSNVSVIVIIVFVLIVVVLNFFLIRSIIVPIRKVKEAAGEIAEGNLNNILEYNSKDEVGELSHNFNKTVLRLKDYIKYIDEITSTLDKIAGGDLAFELEHDYNDEFRKIKVALENISNTFNMAMGNISQTANQVSDSANQVSDSSQALAQATTQQASSVEELVASIEKISDRVDVNSQNAQEAKQLAYSFGETIKESNVEMTKMTESMIEITETSNEISKIIKLIDDIAFQTNILSLNAAVEAARAGSAGKGFAVVADEVRNLATKSAEAAKNTSDLIKRSISAVDNGTKIADETAASLSSVTEKTQKLISTMDFIAESSESQSDAVSQIKDGIEQISNVVQTNSATAEQSASISQELSHQAEILKSLVGRFRLKNDFSFQNNYVGQGTPIPLTNNSENIHTNSTPIEIELEGDDDYNNNTPNEIVLNENDANAYAPELTLVKSDNGSDKY